MRHLRPAGAHLPPPVLRGLQGPAEGDARGAGPAAPGAQGGAGRHGHPPLRAGGVRGRRPHRHHLPEVRGRGLGVRGGHRGQGQPPAHHGQDEGEAGVHPHGPDHHQGHDGGGLPGGLRLRPHPHHRSEGPHGGRQRQHPRGVRRGREDCHGPDPAVPDRGRHLRGHAGGGGPPRRHQAAGGGGGFRPDELPPGHHRHRRAPGV